MISFGCIYTSDMFIYMVSALLNAQVLFLKDELAIAAADSAPNNISHRPNKPPIFSARQTDAGKRGIPW
jgi:hypothetical protein